MQVVPLSQNAADDEALRREMARESQRSHVAYPHLHYPATRNRPEAHQQDFHQDDRICLSCVPPPPSVSSFMSPSTSLLPAACNALAQKEVTQVDYAHFLVPDLLDIARCSFYWGVMDRYEAERLLENKPEGSFLLRDSAQEEYLFSVSFRRYGRSLHARIDQSNHTFSFDTHDSGVFSARTVTGLIEHYKDPGCCMFFEPMLTIHINRTFPFSLLHLTRSVICSRTSYDDVNMLPLPPPLKDYLKYYHYKIAIKKVKKVQQQFAAAKS